MWISRADYEHLRDELATERARRQQLEIQCVQAQTGREWLETRINSLELERAALTERLLAVTFPVPQIARSNEVPAAPVEMHGRPVEEMAIPPHLAGAMRKMPAMTVPQAQKATRPAGPPDDPGASITALQAANLAFDDPGDEAAAAAGISHDDFGNVTYAR